MKKIIQLVVLSFSLIVSMQATATLLTSEPIVTNPVSTENLWEYSYQTGVYLSSGQYVTDPSQFASATHQGYVVGDTHPTSTTVDFFSSMGVSGDNYTAHVFSTYIMSTIDQTLSFVFDGDDGHSLFLDGVFLDGGGYSIDGYANITMLANTSYNLTFVGTNATGPWSWWINCLECEYGLSSGSNILMNAADDFDTGGAIPEPATLALMVLGLVGISYKHKKSK
jgi:hypothetical protein